MYIDTFDVVEENTKSSVNLKSMVTSGPNQPKNSIRGKIQSTMTHKISKELAALQLGVKLLCDRHYRQLILLNDLILCVRDSTSLFSKLVKYECKWYTPLHLCTVTALDTWPGKAEHEKGTIINMKKRFIILLLAPLFSLFFLITF